MAENINIKINVDSKQAKTAVDGLNQSTTKFTENSSKGFSKLSGAVSVFGGVLASNIVLGAFSKLTGAVGNTFGAFRDFEKALLEIETILPKDAKLTDNLRASLIRLSTQFGTSQEKQAKAFYQTVSAGITDSAAAFKVLDAANKVALGGLSDVESSINVITDILNVYGQENISAADSADILFQTVKLGKTRISDLSSSLGSVLPIAKQLGVSFVEVAAATAELTTKGQTTSERVTQLNSLFTAVIKNQDRAAKISKELGDAFSVTALKTKGLSKFIEDLLKATGGSEAVLQELIGRTEGVKAVFGLAQGGIEGFNKTLAEYENRAGAAAESSEKIKESIDFKFDQAISQTQQLATAFFNLTKPIITTGLGALNDVLFALTTDGPQGIKKLEGEAKVLEVRIKSLQKSSEDGGFLGRRASEQLNEARAELARLNSEIDILRSKTPTTSGGANGVDKDEESRRQAIIASKQLELETIKALEEDRRLQLQEQADIDQAEFDVAAEERLSKLAAILGEEEAIKIQAEQVALQRQNKFTEARKKLEAAETKAKAKEGKARTAQIKFEEKVQIASFQATGSLLNSLSQLSATAGKKNFALTKALALAAIPVNTAAAVMNAYANVPAPANIPAAIAAGVAGAAQFINVAQSKPPAFENGGIVPGTSFSGDNQIAAVNSGELILNQSQSDNIANQLQGPQGDIVIQIDGREIARAVRDQQSQGFNLLPIGA